jgi:hypothetical protein
MSDTSVRGQERHGTRPGLQANSTALQLGCRALVYLKPATDPNS